MQRTVSPSILSILPLKVWRQVSNTRCFKPGYKCLVNHVKDLALLYKVPHLVTQASGAGRLTLRERAGSSIWDSQLKEIGAKHCRRLFNILL